MCLWSGFLPLLAQSLGPQGALSPFLLCLHSPGVAAVSATQIFPGEGCLLGVPGPSSRQGDDSVVSLVNMMENGILATLCHAGLYPIWHSLVSTGKVKWLLGKGRLGGSLCCAEPGLRWGPSLEIFGDKLAKEFVPCRPRSECLCPGV